VVLQEEFAELVELSVDLHEHSDQITDELIVEECVVAGHTIIVDSGRLERKMAV
jgi:hypothetical protein